MKSTRRTIKQIRRKRTKKTPISRFFLLISFILVVVVVMCAHTSWDSRVTASNQAEEPHYVVVSRGDTLWSIAQSIEGSNYTDPRKLVYNLREMNNLSSNTIYPGQKLLVPALITQ